jgi:RNA polymerase sigma-70 factor (ECF subfamily)
MLTRYYQELLSFCFRKTRDRDAAEDLAQESFVRVLSMQQAGQAIFAPRALLCQVAARAKIDLDRRASTRQVEEIDALDEFCDPTIPAYQQPDEIYATSQTVDAYMKVIETLPPRCREAFCLHAIDELPNAEIAGRMGISLSLVKRYVKHGKDACQVCRLSRDGKGGTAG